MVVQIEPRPQPKGNQVRIRYDGVFSSEGLEG